MRRVIYLLILWFAAPVFAQKLPDIQRSSSPLGIQLTGDASIAIRNAPKSNSTVANSSDGNAKGEQSGADTATARATQNSKDAVNISGNTRVNAKARNTTANVSGEGSASANSLGVVGEH